MVVDHSGIYRVHMLASTLARGHGRLRLHCLLAPCGHMFNPRKGCWRAMQDAIGAGQYLADLPLRYQRTHPVLMTHHERPISRDTMKAFGVCSPQEPQHVWASRDRATLFSWMTGGMLPLCVLHGVCELVIAMPAIDIGTRLLRDAKRGHERACIPERLGGVVDLLRCGSHDDLLSRPSRDVAERERRTSATVGVASCIRGSPACPTWATVGQSSTDADVR